MTSSRRISVAEHAPASGTAGTPIHALCTPSAEPGLPTRVDGRSARAPALLAAVDRFLADRRVDHDPTSLLTLAARDGERADPPAD